MSDLISKEKAYKVLTEYYHHKTEMQHKALREALDMVPSADIDLSGYSDRLWKAAYERGKAEAEPKWIPVENELPEEGEMVLVTAQPKKGDPNVNRAYYADGFWHGSGSMSNVTAWIPLPTPYRGEADA